MSGSLFGLYLCETGEPLLWRTGGLPSAVEVCPLERVAERTRGGRVMVWVPGDAVTRLQVDTPLRAPHKLREALPYLLEEDLAAPYEDTHLAWRRVKNGVDVGIVSRARMSRWRDDLASLGDAVACLAADEGLLPEGRDAVLLRPDGFSARLSDGRRFAGSVEALPVWLDLALGGQGDETPPREVLLHTLVSEEPPRKEGEGWRLVPASLPRLDPEDRSSLELRSGEFAPASVAGMLWRAWWPAAAALALWAVVAWLAALHDTRALRAELAAQRVAAEALYRETFPEAQVVELPKAQMAQQLSVLRAADSLRSGDLIALMQRVREPLRAHAAGKVERIEYGGDRVRFVLRGVEADVGVLKTAFSGVAGWQVDVKPGAQAGALDVAFVREVGDEPVA